VVRLALNHKPHLALKTALRDCEWSRLFGTNPIWE
jgi:hypothetical protein